MNRYPLVAVFLLLVVDVTGTETRTGKRPVTVADSIEMVQIADRSYRDDFLAKGDDVAHFSPNGSRFAVVTRKGNLAQNTVEFSIIVFATADVLHKPKPETILTLASSSNRDAISKLTWLSDNDSIVFLGERPGEQPQVYRVSSRTRSLEKLTNHPTELTSFVITPTGDRLIYVARAEKAPGITESMRQHGFTLTTENLQGLIREECDKTSGPYDDEVFAVNLPSGTSTRLGGKFTIPEGFGELSLAPGGRFALFRTKLSSVPENWKSYENSALPFFRDLLIDVRNEAVVPLIDAPMNYEEQFAWAPDGASIVLVNSNLPLDAVDPIEQKKRQTHVYIAEIDCQSLGITTIAEHDGRDPHDLLNVKKWDSKTNVLILETQDGSPAVVKYQKNGGTWRPFKGLERGTVANGRVEVMVDEDLNSPPKLVATDPLKRERVELMDLNPQFKELSFGTVEAISWKSRDGSTWRGGLYKPATYAEGKRYPLVIQTHGFGPQRFMIDGLWGTAFAAQALAGKGIVVLQANLPDPQRDDRYFGTTDEGPRSMAGFEGAVDYLEGLGLIDKNRVGLIGFSRTAAHVEYALTHSQYKFAAATAADGVDFSYMQSMLYFDYEGDINSVNGGPPLGEHLSQWLKNAPGFNADKIRTPLRLEADTPMSFLSQWEVYAGLKMQRKPVELVYIPDGDHPLVKPWERMTSQQGNVDWFSFWLMDQEDPDPAKADQYDSWRKMRKALNSGHELN